MEEGRAEAELARLEHRDWDAEYHEACVAAQTHAPGGNEWFWRLVSERDARLVLAGKKVLTDFAPYERPGIEAAMERLRAGGGR
jgi:monoamine oxidase